MTTKSSFKPLLADAGDGAEVAGGGKVFEDSATFATLSDDILGRVLEFLDSSSLKTAENLSLVSKQWRLSVCGARRSVQFSCRLNAAQWMAKIKDVVARHPRLDEATFDECNIRLEQLETLAEATRGRDGKSRLRRLTLFRCFNLPDQVLHSMARLFPLLQELRMSNLRITEAGLSVSSPATADGRAAVRKMQMPRFPCMLHLSIINSIVVGPAETVFRALDILDACPNLQSLAVGGLQCSPTEFWRIPDRIASMPVGIPRVSRARHAPGAISGTPAASEALAGLGRHLWLIECRQAVTMANESMPPSFAAGGVVAIPGAPSSPEQESPPRAFAEALQRAQLAAEEASILSLTPTGSLSASDAAAAAPLVRCAPPTTLPVQLVDSSSSLKRFLGIMAAACRAQRHRMAAKPAVGATAAAAAAAASAEPPAPREEVCRWNRVAEEALRTLQFASNARTASGFHTAIMQACQVHDTAGVLLELGLGADPRRASARQTLPVSVCCEVGAVSCLCALLGVSDYDATAAAQTALVAGVQVHRALSAAAPASEAAAAAAAGATGADEPPVAGLVDLPTAESALQPLMQLLAEVEPPAEQRPASATGAPLAPPASPAAASAGTGRGAAWLAVREEPHQAQQERVSSGRQALVDLGFLLRVVGVDLEERMALARMRGRQGLLRQNMRAENACHVATIRGHPCCVAAVLLAEEEEFPAAAASEAGASAECLAAAAPAAEAPACARPVQAMASGPVPTVSADDSEPRLKLPRGRLSEVRARASTASAGWTALHAASVWGDVAVTQLLLAAGHSVAETNRFGMTPLHSAAWSRQRLCCASLLHAGANPLAEADNGNLPWYDAQQRGAGADVVAMLAQAAAAAATTPEAATLAGAGTSAVKRKGGRRRHKSKAPTGVS